MYSEYACTVHQPTCVDGPDDLSRARASPGQRLTILQLGQGVGLLEGEEGGSEGRGGREEGRRKGGGGGREGREGGRKGATGRCTGRYIIKGWNIFREL